MDRFKKAALLSALADDLRKKGSWCGETHLQKATYFLQTLQKVPVGFDFILYKHGPFSFELRDELTAMRADGFLELRLKPPYGPSLVTTEIGQELRAEHPRTLDKHRRAIRFVAEQLATRNVSELERLATALFVTLDGAPRSAEERAEEIKDLKPHIDLESAEAAVGEVEEMMGAARAL